MVTGNSRKLFPSMPITVPSFSTKAACVAIVVALVADEAFPGASLNSTNIQSTTSLPGIERDRLGAVIVPGSGRNKAEPVAD